MTALVRRVAPLLLLGLLTGCGTSTAPSASATRGPTAEPSLTPVPGAPSATPERTLPPTSVPETNANLGPIWDALPPSWPVLPGQTQSEVGSDASDQLIVKGRPVALAGQLGAALTSLGWSVDIGSPLEDGTVVLDASAPPKGCAAEVRFEGPPGDDTVRLLVYVGAACPFT